LVPVSSVYYSTRWSFGPCFLRVLQYTLVFWSLFPPRTTVHVVLLVPVSSVYYSTRWSFGPCFLRVLQYPLVLWSLFPPCTTVPVGLLVPVSSAYYSTRWSFGPCFLRVLQYPLVFWSLFPPCTTVHVGPFKVKWRSGACSSSPLNNFNPNNICTTAHWNATGSDILALVTLCALSVHTSRYVEPVFRM
jgi:hypothetical protein